MWKGKMLWMFLTLLLLIGCQENRRSEEKKEEEPLVIVERTDAPVHDAQTVARLFHLGYTKAELAAFGPPPSPRSGYVTFFDPGWKIHKFCHFWDHAAFLELELPKQYPDVAMLWVGKTTHIQEEKPRYRQLRMGPAQETFGKRWDEQCALLLPDDEVPLLRQVMAAFVIHYALAGETLFPHWCTLRCADPVRSAGKAGSGHVVVMVFQPSTRERPTLWIDTQPDEWSHYRCGLLSARCLP